MISKKEENIPVKSFTIDYERWGQDNLLHEGWDGTRKMCCLGFLGRACGISANNMLERSSPDDLPGAEAARYPSFIAYVGVPNSVCHTDLTDDLMQVNDNGRMPDYVRMRVITSLFAEEGMRVRWKNVPPAVWQDYCSLRVTR